MRRRRTQVHVDGAGPLGVGHVLVNGVQDLLLHLCDGVAVEHLHRNLWAVFVVRIDAVQDLGGGGENEVTEGAEDGPGGPECAGAARTRVQVEAFPSLEAPLSIAGARRKPFPPSLPTQNLISHLRQDINFQLCRSIST